MSHILHIAKKWGVGTLLRTLRFNYRHWGWKAAMHPPVIVGKDVHFNQDLGKITLLDVSFAAVTIGINNIGIFDKKYSRTVLELCEGSTITWGKNVCIGQGCKISVQKGAHLTLENDVCFTAETIVVCAKKITFSEGCLISWHGQFMDSDLHTVKNSEGKITNSPAEIFIAPYNWFGSGVTVFKGTRIGPHNVVGANTALYGSNFSETSHSVIAGNPGAVVKTGIAWNR